MGVYVVTGGTKGIGEKTVELLKNAGEEVVNVDIAGGDINADIGSKEGRRKVIDELHARYPDGIDGLVANAGIASHKKFSRVLAVNYFGPIEIITGLYDLLLKKGGNCVITVSGSVAYLPNNKYRVDELLVNCGDEERIGELVDTFDPVAVDNTIYGSTKSALIRWMKRTAPAWAVNGVNLNAVAPGGVRTSIMEGQKFMAPDPEFILALPTPTTYKEHRMMEPIEIARTLVFMVSPNSKGICGEVIYCDTGTASILTGDKPFLFNEAPFVR
ncbi:MAG: SDR family oxidoreductase [Oscillospiraceae bacterium]|nr:SDR family oxidoreductase [Oscillospiraceae bacterium]